MTRVQGTNKDVVNANWHRREQNTVFRVACSLYRCNYIRRLDMDIIWCIGLPAGGTFLCTFQMLYCTVRVTCRKKTERLAVGLYIGGVDFIIWHRDYNLAPAAIICQVSS